MQCECAIFGCYEKELLKGFLCCRNLFYRGIQGLFRCPNLKSTHKNVQLFLKTEIEDLARLNG